MPFWKMLWDIGRFNRQAVEVIDNPAFEGMSVYEYAKFRGYDDDFIFKFLVPMSSAVWSSPADAMLAFPVVTLVRFFKNHCFLGLQGHLNWRTCVGGSRQYRDKLLARFKGTVWHSRAAVKVIREAGQVKVLDRHGLIMNYDKAVIACHADEALQILDRPTPHEARLLAHFPYHTNRATLHTDDSVMPKARSAWSSWNYRISKDKDGELVSTTIYDMHSLQGVAEDKHWFVSINDPGLVDPSKVVWERVYHHPLFKVESLKAQHELARLNLHGPVYFCGAYFRYGFHEDGLLSALNVSRLLSEEPIWP